MGTWLAWRYLKTGKSWLNLSSLLAVVGLAIGVGSLVVAMAVVSGYQTTLKRSVIDMMGHMVVTRRSSSESPPQFNELLKQVVGQKAFTPFVFVEAVLAHKGQLSGVAVEGMDEATVHQVLKVKSHLVDGDFSFAEREGASAAMIGVGLARKHDLQVGQTFRVVLPMSGEYDRGRIKPRVSRFYVAGVLDLGRHDFNERYIISALSVVQQFAQIGNRVSGYRFLFDDDEYAKKLGDELAEKLHPEYSVLTWYQVDENLFKAAELEKPAIFLVLLVMVIAAAFNVSSTLYVSVIRRFREISVLKTLGAPSKLLVRLFTVQGLILGAIGAFSGLGLGLMITGLFVWAQNRFKLMPAEVYKLERIYVEINPLDLLIILGTALLICLVATIGPARRGARLPPVEGLRYE